MATAATRTGPFQLPSIGADTAALWVLVGLELAALVALRSGFRRYHGG